MGLRRSLSSEEWVPERGRPGTRAASRALNATAEGGDWNGSGFSHKVLNAGEGIVTGDQRVQRLEARPRTRLAALIGAADHQESGAAASHGEIVLLVGGFGPDGTGQE